MIDVKIGNISLGANNNVVVQTMTNTDTNKIEATVNQCTELFDAGAKLVRITAQTEKEAEKLKKIKTLLLKKGYNLPIIADIHFKPKAAIIASRYVEKIRINPGNYTKPNDTKSLEHKLLPLIKSCKENNTTIRIGSNFGSLSKKILEKYGNTPLGMLEAGWEFIDVCVKNNFDDIVVSMKAGDVKIMIDACRLLQNKMIKTNLIFPQHLGVTEAGNGIEARIKSTIGIATLLSEGIGDTIRVSLTENPVNEIPVAQKIIDYFSCKKHIKKLNYKKVDYIPKLIDNKYIVIADTQYKNKDLQTADFVFIDNIKNINNSTQNFLCNSKIWENKENLFPVFSLTDYRKTKIKNKKYNFIECSFDELNKENLNKIEADKTSVIIINTNNICDVFDLRNRYNNFIKELNNTPVILKRAYTETEDDFIIKSSGELGSILIDKLASGIWIENKNEDGNVLINLSFGILQATKLRITKTEFISCPTCGRTKFDIEEITKQVKEKTSHLKGLKIAVMGCVVNGPGEMADADYGYVGSSENKVHLYKKDHIIKKNILQEDALNQLISIIKENGDWIEKAQRL